MFTSLKALAQTAPLMITIASAADDQLRVAVSPTYTGDVPKSALKPLVLTGSAAELDADFISAIEIWQAPKRSIIEQAQAAAGGGDDEGDDEQDSATAGRKPRATNSKAKDDKPARGKRTDAAPASKAAAAPAPASVAAETSVAPASENETAPAVTPAQTSGPAVDTVTLNLF